MKTPKSLCTGFLAMALTAAAGLVADVEAAHADIITLDVSGSLSPQFGSNSCAATGCTLGGQIVIDNTAGTVLSADVTATGLFAIDTSMLDTGRHRMCSGVYSLTRRWRVWGRIRNFFPDVRRVTQGQRKFSY